MTVHRLKPSFPVIAVVLFGLLLAGELGWLRREKVHASRALGALERAKQERDRLATLSPAPSEENEAAMADALKEAQQTLAQLRERLATGRQAAGGALPTQSAEGFFALAKFVAQTRIRAEQAHVALRPVEHFGFSAYANASPPSDLLPSVHRQRSAVEILCDALWEARPVALLAVRRERPGQGGDSSLSPGEGDYFTLPAALSLRQRGLVETDAFRLEFTGETVVLRRFLNALASLRPAAIVRAVEVEPFRAKAAAGGAPTPEGSALFPPQVSQFAVSLEIPRVGPTGEPRP